MKRRDFMKLGAGVGAAGLTGGLPFGASAQTKADNPKTYAFIKCSRSKVLSADSPIPSHRIEAPFFAARFVHRE